MISPEQCFGTFDDAKFQETTLDNTWRLWVFQVCTEWGYFSVTLSQLLQFSFAHKGL